MRRYRGRGVCVWLWIGLALGSESHLDWWLDRCALVRWSIDGSSRRRLELDRALSGGAAGMHFRRWRVVL